MKIFFKLRFSLPVFFFSLASLIIMVALTTTLFKFTKQPQSVHAQVDRKNIVFIMTDDQPYHTIQYMPKTNALIGDLGVRFSNAFNSTSLCCPSRASSLSGKYSHNTNILGNEMPWGGAQLFKENNSDQSTIATWLQATGYKTYFVGKYLNEYGSIAPYQPPGWDEWHALTKIGSEGAYQNWYMIENGTEYHYNNPESANYSVNVMRDKAVQFIQNTPTDQPLFLYFTPTAPHQPATPDPIDSGTFSTLLPYRPPSYNEADVSDKPSWVRNLPLWTAAQQDAADSLYRKQVESLQSVDRAVEAIVNALEATGRLENTAIVYVSDNGYSLGAHRWEKKECVYSECSKTSLLVRAPGVTPRTDDSLILNVDFPVTFAQWAGITPPYSADGQSFADLLFNPALPWRDNALLEVLGRPHSHKMNFQGLVTKQYLYAEYTEGDRELYDLAVDPYELTNVYTNPNYSSIITDLHSKLMAYKVPADLQITMTPSNISPAPGSQVTYTLNLTNLGPSHSAGVYLTSVFPSSLQIDSCGSTANGVCSSVGNQRIIKYISLASGSSATVTIGTTVKTSTPTGTTIEATASVNGFTSVDANPINDQSTALVTTFVPLPSPTPTRAPTPTPTPTSTPGADTQLPNVTITNPRNNAKIVRGSTVNITATATDNVAVSRVEFYVNDSLVCQVPSAPYSCSWIIPSRVGLSYVIRAKAIDTTGNFKNAQITVTSK